MQRSFQRNDNPALRFILRAFGCFVVLATCLRVWIGPFSILPEAYGQIPDAGMQRKLILEEAVRTNQLLADIKIMLAERTLNVRIQGADNPAGAGKPRG
jgi:hypothetical protein